MSFASEFFLSERAERRRYRKYRGKDSYRGRGNHVSS